MEHIEKLMEDYDLAIDSRRLDRWKADIEKMLA